MVKRSVMKKIILLFLALSVFLCLGVTATACGGKNPPPHECEWEATLSKDATHHWYACKDDTCELVKDKETHEFVEGVCECGYEDPNYVPPHECEFEETLSKDATHHWYACKDDTCELVKDKEAHEFVEGVCECGYEDPSYTDPDEPGTDPDEPGTDPDKPEGNKGNPPGKPNKEDSYEAK